MYTSEGKALIYTAVLIFFVATRITVEAAGSGTGGPGSSRSKTDPALRCDGAVSWFDADNKRITTIDVEIADTRRQRITGLKGRHLRDFSQGMLFVYPDAAPRTFIMTDTPAPLDILFIDENNQVLNIHHHTRPMSDSTYRSQGPSVLVIEVRAGFCTHHGIRPGNRVRWRRY